MLRPEQVVKRPPWFPDWESGKGVGSPWVNWAGPLGSGFPRHRADVNISMFPRVFSTCAQFLSVTFFPTGVRPAGFFDCACLVDVNT